MIMKLNFHYLLVLFVACLLAQSCKDKEEACLLTCDNGGVLTIDCTCSCPNGYEGSQCETATCTIACQNNGSVTADCACDCPLGWEGPLCETCTPWFRFAPRAGTLVSGSPNYVDDLEATLPDDYVLTGFGFSTNSTLMIAGREILSDGTLGDEYQDRSGSNPNGPFQVTFIAPANHVITGVGFGEINNEFRRLVVNYSEILIDSDCQISLGLPKLYDNNDPLSVDAWLRVIDTGLDVKYNAFRGLGLRFSNSPEQVEAPSGLIDNN